MMETHDLRKVRIDVADLSIRLYKLQKKIILSVCLEILTLCYFFIGKLSTQVCEHILVYLICYRPMFAFSHYLYNCNALYLGAFVFQRSANKFLSVLLYAIKKTKKKPLWMDLEEFYEKLSVSNFVKIIKILGHFTWIPSYISTRTSCSIGYRPPHRSSRSIKVLQPFIGFTQQWNDMCLIISM
jgi:hypothetical protein